MVGINKYEGTYMYNFKSTKLASYVYMCTHKLSGRFYIGYRESNVKLRRTSDVDFPIYRSSSKAVKNHFDEFDWIIVAEFESGADAYAFEHQLINENWYNPLLLNQHCCYNGHQFRRTSPPWNKNTVGLYKRTAETKKKIREKRELQVMGVSPLKGKTLKQIHGDKEGEVRKNIATAIKLALSTIEAKEKNKNKMLALWANNDFKKHRSESIKNGWDKGRDLRSGLNHSKSDKTIYTFVHDSGLIENLSRVEMVKKHKIGNISRLISGVIKSSMGWKVINKE